MLEHQATTAPTLHSAAATLWTAGFVRFIRTSTERPFGSMRTKSRTLQVGSGTNIWWIIYWVSRIESPWITNVQISCEDVLKTPPFTELFILVAGASPRVLKLAVPRFTGHGKHVEDMERRARRARRALAALATSAPSRPRKLQGWLLFWVELGIPCGADIAIWSHTAHIDLLDVWVGFIHATWQTNIAMKTHMAVCRIVLDSFGSYKNHLGIDHFHPFSIAFFIQSGVSLKFPDEFSSMTRCFASLVS